MEFWRDIPDYEGFYQASNLGRIRRCGIGNIIKPMTTRDGYHRLSLSKRGKIKNMFVHRLIAGAFIPNLQNKSFINHLDGNKQNNKVDNLEWVTSHENTIHSYKIGLQSKKGEKNSQSILTEAQAREIKKKNQSAKELALKFRVSTACIKSIWAGINCKHLK